MNVHPHLKDFADKLEEYPINERYPIRNEFMMYTHRELRHLQFRIFSYSQFTQCVLINGSDHMKFEHCVFEFGVNLTNFNGSVSFEGCVFVNGNIHYEDVERKFIAGCCFDDCAFENCLDLALIHGFLELRNCELNQVRLIGEIESLLIGSKCKLDSLIIQDDCKGVASVNISESEINKVHYSPGFKSNSELIIRESCNINELLIFRPPLRTQIARLTARVVSANNFTNGGFISLRYSNVSSVEIESFSNNGEIVLHDNVISSLNLSTIGEPVSISLRKVYNLKVLYLSHIKSRNVVFSEVQVDKIHIGETNFDDWSIGYIDWGKSFRLELSKYNETNRPLTNRYLELMEINRRFKRYFQLKENPVDASIFQRNELSSYLKFLLHKKWQLSKSQFFDFLLLGTNRIFSNFGQSFVLPLLWLFVIHSILFYLLVNNYDLGFNVCFEFTSACIFSKEIFGYYLNLINPIHKLADINGNFLITVEDFFMRISSGYFIFYFLKATRKFSN